MSAWTCPPGALTPDAGRPLRRLYLATVDTTPTPVDRRAALGELPAGLRKCPHSGASAEHRGSGSACAATQPDRCCAASTRNPFGVTPSHDQVQFARRDDRFVASCVVNSARQRSPWGDWLVRVGASDKSTRSPTNLDARARTTPRIDEDTRPTFDVTYARDQIGIIAGLPPSGITACSLKTATGTMALLAIAPAADAQACSITSTSMAGSAPTRHRGLNYTLIFNERLLRAQRARRQLGRPCCAVVGLDFDVTRTGS